MNIQNQRKDLENWCMSVTKGEGGVVTMKLKKLKLTDALLHKIYYETM